MARQLAITKKTYLDGFDGWGKDCYVEWRPVTYAESLEMKNIETPTDDASAFDIIFTITKQHIVGGKGNVLSENGETELVDYTSEDLDNMPASVINHIFADITGAQYDDPKDSSQELETS